MRVPIRLKPAVVAAAAVAVVAGFATPAFASTPAPSFGHSGASHAVFVQTDSTSGNHVVAYHRAADGLLRPAGS